MIFVDFRFENKFLKKYKRKNEGEIKKFIESLGSKTFEIYIDYSSIVSILECLSCYRYAHFV